MAFGFEGAITYEVVQPEGGAGAERSDWWTIDVGPRKATARRGRVGNAAAVIHVTVADLLRLVAGDLSALTAAVEGRVRVQGDVLLAARVREMFGGT
jgi:putative sterol carrier protein